MKTKFLFFLVVCFMITSVFSQSNLNNYKYIIVPKKYGFLNDADQYQLNSLTEFLFNKHGFKAFMEGADFPDDLNADRCLALTSDLVKDSNLFKTKLQIELKNCNGLAIYTTQTGESREKDFNKAYNEALRNTFKELETISHEYVPNNKGSQTVAKQVENKTEVVEQIAQLKAEIANLKQEKETQIVEVVEKNIEPKGETVIESSVSKTKIIDEGVKQVFSNVLYPQEIENGFQLVDSTPKVVYRIKNTGVDNVFLVEGKSAIIYKKGNDWILEYYSGNTLKKEDLNIKF